MGLPSRPDALRRVDAFPLRSAAHREDGMKPWLPDRVVTVALNRSCHAAAVTCYPTGRIVDRASSSSSGAGAVAAVSTSIASDTLLSSLSVLLPVRAIPWLCPVPRPLGGQ